MRILDIREAALPMRSDLRNSVFSFAEMTVSVVAVLTDRVVDGAPVVGYAFNSIGRYACGDTMRARFIPRLLCTPPDDLLDRDGFIDPARAVRSMLVGEKPGGDAARAVPIGTIETALWDAVAKARRVPLAELISQTWRQRPMEARVPCYVGGGWYKPDSKPGDVTDELQRHLDAGYTHMKIKVGGLSLAEDVGRVEEGLKLLGDPQRLSVDANGRFSVEEALDYARALAPFALRWFEEPCHPNDFSASAAVADAYSGALAGGENLFSPHEVWNQVRFGGWRSDRDYLQMDPPQFYGVGTYADLVRDLAAEGWDVSRHFPHGGNQMSLALVAGLGLGGCEAYPGFFGAFGGYADDCEVSDGSMPSPQRPGIGFEGQSRLYALMRGVATGWV
ncbi:enolase C-terminal domain-like protein [Sphingosinicella soli]|uniref:L-alanine-DL-glutamate epimerase-like enolase superfamily enzyme n=1 Tax=Sphingosinicella soli TaxID=333708 RepID=A0A7W7B3J6_9SPHN|nr:enolase C-terminal domain-like protein [Sphingosinicella soli]MBB4633358.1 L-alanine-DL-glutamate epimerase-like enolase superfamily enzyme [Sphingosinicella soli]